MGYAETFADLLAQQGISVDAADVPDRAQVDDDVQRLGDWLGSLDQDTHDAVDEATGENAVQAALADPDVAVVQSIGAVLAGFDNQQSVISISQAMQVIAAASSQAADAQTGKA